MATVPRLMTETARVECAACRNAQTVNITGQRTQAARRAAIDEALAAAGWRKDERGRDLCDRHAADGYATRASTNVQARHMRIDDDHWTTLVAYAKQHGITTGQAMARYIDLVENHG